MVIRVSMRLVTAPLQIWRIGLCGCRVTTRAPKIER
jgi:hypothetical protein